MPGEEGYDCKRKELISHVSQNLNKSGWIRQLDGVRRRLYHTIINN